MRPVTVPALTAERAPWALRTAPRALSLALKMPAASGSWLVRLTRVGDRFSSGPATCFIPVSRLGTRPSAASGLSRSFCARRAASTATRLANVVAHGAGTAGQRGDASSPARRQGLGRSRRQLGLDGRRLQRVLLVADELAQGDAGFQRDQRAGLVGVLAGRLHIGQHEPALVVAIAEYQGHRLVCRQGVLELGQLGLGVAVVQMEGELDADFVELVADELQARLALDQGMFGEVGTELRLEAVEVGDEVELDVAQERKHVSPPRRNGAPAGP